MSFQCWKPIGFRVSESRALRERDGTALKPASGGDCDIPTILMESPSRVQPKYGRSEKKKKKSRWKEGVQGVQLP